MSWLSKNADEGGIEHNNREADWKALNNLVLKRVKKYNFAEVKTMKEKNPIKLYVITQ